MTLEDWHQAQEADPILHLVTTRLRDGMLQKSQSKATDPPKSVNLGKNRIILLLKGVSYTDKSDQGNYRRPSSSWFYQLHRGRLLSGDAMMRLVIWAWSTCWISCMTGSFGLTWLHRQRSMSGNVTHVLLSKPGNQKPLSKTLWPHYLYSWSALITCVWNLGKNNEQSWSQTPLGLYKNTEVHLVGSEKG